MTEIIRDWTELALCTSLTHYLEIDFMYGSGHIRSFDKGDNSYGPYLSTHTFYGPSDSNPKSPASHKESTRLLRDAGFDVIIDNWDNPLSDDIDKEQYIKDLEEEHTAEVRRHKKIQAESDIRDSMRNIHSTNIFGTIRRTDSEYIRRKQQGRNEPCACSSGKKFKHCCGN